MDHPQVGTGVPGPDAAVAPPGGWSAPGAGSPTPTERRPADPTRPVTAPPPEPVALRPMAVMTLLDGGAEVLKSRPRALLVAAAVPLLPILALCFWARGGPYRFDLATLVVAGITGDSGFSDAFDRHAVLLWSTAVAEMLPLFVVGVIVARGVSSWYAGGDPGARVLLREGLRRPVTTLGAFVVSTLAKGVGALFFCIGAPLAAAWLVTTSPVLAVEGLGGAASLRRAASLSNRRYFPVLGTVLLVAVVDQFLRAGLVVVPWMVAESVPEPAAHVLRWASMGFAAVVSAVFVGATATLQYLDLRIRTEGLDLELDATEAFPLDA